MNREATKDVVPVERRSEVQRPTPRWPRDIFQEMETLMERMTSPSFLRPWRWELPRWSETQLGIEGRVPSIDLIDGSSEIVIRAELPGVEKKDLEVSVSDNSVTIKGNVHREEKVEEGEYYRCERVRGAYQRVVDLPAAVNGEKAKAKFTNGLLELHLPKLEASKRHKIKLD